MPAKNFGGGAVVGQYARTVWRALKSHVLENHRLRVQRCSARSNELEIRCLFCDVPVLAGSPGIVNEIADSVAQSGGSVFKLNISSESVRVH